MKFKELILLIIRILLGSIFVSSAILKLFSLDNFILYTYSFGIFGYVATTILARILIIIEFLLGIGLIFSIFYKITWWGTISMLSVFSIFLIYVALFRGDENCHCFGDFVNLNAVPSIIKNLIMISLLLLVKKQNEFRHKLKPYIVTISISSILFVAFIGFPPDALYNIMHKDNNDRFNQQAFEKYTADSLYSNLIDSSKNEIIGLVSASCKHCKSGNRKMQAIFEQNNINKEGFKNLVWTNSDSLLVAFKDTTKTQDFFYQKMSPVFLIEINYGYFPTYVFFEKGTPIKAINYKEINEKEIVDFLKQENFPPLTPSHNANTQLIE
ncbi:MAG: DoxX family membrane protein [Bacteroidales bacterium]|nr:DoxX family membrane protein [Bacteroidales bacterium]